MKIGYINSIDQLSNQQQKIMLQQKAHCDVIHIERRSKGENNKKLVQLMGELRQGDQLIVCSLYVFSMSLLNILKLIESLERKGIGFVSFEEDIYDTELLSQLSRFNKYTRKQRSLFGLDSRKRGQEGGRPEGLSEKAQETAKAAAALYNNKMPTKGILSALGIGSTDTLYKYLRHEGVEIGKKDHGEKKD